jgi:hypothetical protein
LLTKKGACDFLRRKFASLNFPLVLLALIGQSDFYFQKVTRTHQKPKTPEDNIFWGFCNYSAKLSSMH